MSESFLTKLATASTEVLQKGGTGSKTSIHAGDAYVNKQGRIYGLSEKHNAYFDIEVGSADGTPFIKVKPSDATGTDSKGKKTYSKTAFKTSAESTGTAFITITKLCKQLFGTDKDNWHGEFNKVGEQDGYTFYALMDEAETAKSTKTDKAETVKKTK